MKKGYFRRFTAFFLAVAMVFSLLPTTVLAAEGEVVDRSVVSASNEEDGITVTKKAEFTSVDGNYVDANGNPYVKITFTVDADEMSTSTQEEIADDTDIVLVIDNSSSMGEGTGSKLERAKSAAVDFANKLYEMPGSTVRIGLVYFDKFVDETNETIDLTGKENSSTVINKIKAITKGSGTNIQAGLYYGQKMLEGSNATNKIMVLLSDGAPYQHLMEVGEESSGKDSDNPTKEGNVIRLDRFMTELINDYIKEYGDNWKSDVLSKINEEKNFRRKLKGSFEDTYGEDDGERYYKWLKGILEGTYTYITYTVEEDNEIEGDSTSIKVEDENAFENPYYVNYEYDARYNSSNSEHARGAIDQAYLARKEIPGINIYTIGYDVADDSTAQDTLKKIADKDSDFSAAVDGLEGVFNTIVEDVEQKINSVSLDDLIPIQMKDCSEFTYDNNTAGKVENTIDVESGDVTFTWANSLAKQTYSMSFVTTVDLSKLNAQDFLNNPYFNTNGEEITVAGTGDNSSELRYGNDGSIKLPSPQLQLDTSKYEVHYYYDNEEDATQKVDTTYVWNIENAPTPTYNVLDKNKDTDTYELDKVEINGKGGQFGNLAINEDKVVNVYYKKIVKKDVIIKKAWDDNNNQDGLRTEVTAVLKDEDGNFAKNFKGTVVGENIILNEDNDWTVRLTDLRADEVYSVLEMASVEGYEKSEVETSTTTVNGKEVVTYTLTNTHTPETTNVNVVVQWDDDSNRDGIRPDKVTIELYKTVDGKTTLVETTTTDNGTTFENLPVYEDGKKITYSVEQKDVRKEYTTTTAHSNNGIDFKFINKYEPKKTSVTVKKNWVDGNNEEGKRTSIQVQLLANGTAIEGKTATLTETNGYSVIFSGLYVKEGGKDINYTIQEVDVPEGYKSNLSNDGLTLTNTYNQDKLTSVTVNKEWEDEGNVDGLRPGSISVTLKATVSEGAEAIADKTATIKASDNWTYTFEELKAYDTNGAKVKYNVVENTKIDGYTTSYAGNGTKTVTITNKHTKEVKDVTVSKVWSGDAHVASIVRPSKVTLTLYANGQALEGKTVEVSGDDSDATWNYTFEKLPVNYLNNGKSTPIKYTVVEEDTLENYNKSADGLTVTNTYVPIMTSHTVEKKWDDNNNHDGKRTDKVEVTLYGKTATKDNYKVETVSFGKGDNGWTYTFNNLPLYNDQGEEITYSVKETKVAGYEAPTYDDVTTDRVTTITNSRENELTSLKVKKVWADGDNRDGLRPTSIKVKLLCNGNEFKEVTLKEGNWEHTWDNLEVYGPNANGGVIENVYTVVEVLEESARANYSSQVKYNNDNTEATITNTHKVKTTNLAVTKTWEDNSDQDGIRPDSVIVYLTANGKKYGEDIVLSDSNKWTYTWEDLFVNEAGDEIEYKVVEKNVEGYSSNATNGLTFTNKVANVINTHAPEEFEILVKKVWDDKNNAAGERPEEVELSVMNEDTKVAEVTLNKDNNWQHTIKVDKYANGKLINYTLKEDFIKSGYTVEYSSAVNGDTDNKTLTATNTYNVEKTSLTVEKKWNDNNNQDGYRPATVDVQLLRNGEPYKAPVTLRASEDWTYTWTDLETKRDNDEYTYTVKEVVVPDHYTSDAHETAARFNNNKAVITNTHTTEEVEFQVEKVWEDDNDNDRVRPSYIPVELYAKYGDAEPVKVEDKDITLTYDEVEDDTWTAKWTGLDKKKDGVDIVYSAKEADIPEGYEVSYKTEGYKTVITNTHANEETSFEVVKEWIDDNNNDRVRPNSIKVQLYADREAFGEEVTLSEDNSWTYEWTKLTKLNDGEEIEYTVDEVEVPTGYEKEIVVTDNGQKIINTHANEETSHTVTKVWADNDNNDNYRPTSVEVELYADGVATGMKATLDANNQWTYTWEELTKLNKGNVIEYTVKELNVSEYYKDSYKTENGTTTITNTHEKDEITLTIVKKWFGDEGHTNERPESITVDVYKKVGEATATKVDTVTLTKEAGWKTTIKVDRFEKKQKVEYSVKEATKTPGYSVSYSNPVKDVDSTLIVTNTYNVRYANFTVNKSWIDANNQDGIRPTQVSVQLYKDDEGYGEPQVLSVSNNWTYTWPSLEIERDGQAITYTVEEVTVPTGYTSNAKPVAIGFEENNGSYVATVRNTHTVDKTGFKVVKTWADNNDNDDYRPDSVKVQLKANGQAISADKGGVVELSETNNWTYSWNDLDKKSAGADIKYTVEELDVPSEYTSTVTDLEDGLGQEITNTHNKDQITLTINKAWLGDEGHTDARPESITVDVYKKVGEAAATKVDTVTLTKEDNWTKTINVDRFEKKQKVEYSVKEVTKTSGYTVSYSNSVKDVNSTLTVTNTYNVEYANFTVVKSWNDNNDQDGYRTPSVKVQLKKNNSSYGEVVELNETNNWTYTWGNLETTRDGLNNTYTVEEVNVPEEYTSNTDNGAVMFNKNNDNNYSITVVNTHEIEKTEHSVVKVWDDDNDNDRFRPDKITVQLYVDGEAVKDKKLVLDADNNWTGKWTNLDKKVAGKDVVYTAKEVELSDEYTADYKTEGTVTTITNTHINHVTSFKVVKVWEDNNNNDGYRPDSVKVQLYSMTGADEVAKPYGEVVELSASKDAETNWTYVWNNLPKYKYGQEIGYYVEEINVPEEYTSEVTELDKETELANDAELGQKIINTHEKDQITLTINKVWAGDSEEVIERPKSVTVDLYAGEDKIDTLTLKPGEEQGDVWSTTINVDRYKANQLITYSIKEVTFVSGYTATYSEDVKDVNSELTVTNTYNVVTEDFTVTKQWIDNDNQDGVRPEYIEVELSSVTDNGDIVVHEELARLDDSNGWTYTWTNLETSRDGKETTYFVREASMVEDYESDTFETAVAFDDNNSAVITNTHEIHTRDITVMFKWDDLDDVEKVRAKEMVANLYKVKNKAVEDEENNNDEVVEDEVIVDAETGEIIPRGLMGLPEPLPVPEEELELVDSQVVIEKVEGSEKLWFATFKNVPVNENGKKITYVVRQKDLPNAGTVNEYTYVNTVEDSEEADFVITNRYRKPYLGVEEEEEIIINDDKKDVLAPKEEETEVKETTKKAKKDNTPDTSDPFDMTRYMWMLLLSAMGLLVMFSSKKEEK